MFLIIAANVTLSIVVLTVITGLVARAIRPALAQASGAQVIKLDRNAFVDDRDRVRRAA
jgi:hypothetical protein